MCYVYVIFNSNGIMFTNHTFTNGAFISRLNSGDYYLDVRPMIMVPDYEINYYGEHSIYNFSFTELTTTSNSIIASTSTITTTTITQVPNDEISESVKIFLWVLLAAVILFLIIVSYGKSKRKKEDRLMRLTETNSNSVSNPQFTARNAQLNPIYETRIYDDDYIETI